MVTSGTGHDRCPSLDFPSPSGARKPPYGGALKIRKTEFGFKGPEKFSARQGRLVNGLPQRHKQPRGTWRRRHEARKSLPVVD
jgi:hypothetical protein